jgi:hypothetical protein
MADTTAETRTPAEELLLAAETLRRARPLRDDLVEPLADLLEFLSGCVEYDARRGRSGTMQEQYALQVARPINRKAA